MLPTIEVVYFDLGDTLVGADSRWLPGAQAALTPLKVLGLRIGVSSNTGKLTRQHLAALLPHSSLISY